MTEYRNYFEDVTKEFPAHQGCKALLIQPQNISDAEFFGFSRWFRENTGAIASGAIQFPPGRLIPEKSYFTMWASKDLLLLRSET